MTDNWTVDGERYGHAGWTFRVVLTPDDVRPEGDGDWATAEHIAAWKRDEWEYVIVTVTPVDSRGRAWEADVETLGAVVWGDLDETSHVGRLEIESGTLPDMVSEAMKSVTSSTPWHKREPAPGATYPPMGERQG